MLRSVKQNKDKGFILIGRTNSFGSGNNVIYLIKTDSLGNIHWNKTYGGSNDDGGYSVSQTGDNGYILTGYATIFGNLF